jgi:hypothetical protein
MKLSFRSLLLPNNTTLTSNLTWFLVRVAASWCTPLPCHIHCQGLITAPLLLSGKKRVLDRTTEFIAIHKNRSVFPVKLSVTHLSGAGEDSMFMGMIEVGRLLHVFVLECLLYLLISLHSPSLGSSSIILMKGCHLKDIPEN